MKQFEKLPIPAYGNTPLPQGLKARIADILESEYGIKEFSNPIKIQEGNENGDREIRNIQETKTAGELIMLLKKNEPDLILEEMKKSKNDPEAFKGMLKKYSSYDISDEIKKKINLTAEEKTELESSQQKLEKEWCEKQKSEFLPANIFKKYQNGNYNISYIDDLLVKRNITKTEYLKLLKQINIIGDAKEYSTTILKVKKTGIREKQIDLKKLSKIISKLKERKEIVIKILEKITDKRKIITILNEIDTETIISVLDLAYFVNNKAINTEKIINFLDLVNIDKSIPILKEVNILGYIDLFKDTDINDIPKIAKILNGTNGYRKVPEILNNIKIDSITKILNNIQTDTIINILNRVQTDTIINILNRVQTDTIINILNSVQTDTIINILNNVQTDTITNILDKSNINTIINERNNNTDEFIKKAQKYSQAKKLDKFINILNEKKRLPRRYE